MRFNTQEIEYLNNGYEKLERLFAYKYEVAKSDVALILRNAALHILIDGRLKETITFRQLARFAIEEKTGKVYAK